MRNRADHPGDRAGARRGGAPGAASRPWSWWRAGSRTCRRRRASRWRPAGRWAAGLWMFIPSTARAYGLQVDDAVDERLDPASVTGAAIALLSDLQRYGDWALALAGYNQETRGSTRPSPVSARTTPGCSSRRARSTTTRRG
ncbi:MAG: transglycosylase SLT domain-containing protein [Myxococcota bacterium]